MRKCKLFFKYTIACIGIVVVLSQLLLLKRELRTTLTAVDRLEAQYVSPEQQKGAVTLRLSGVEPNPSIRILENGECIALFTEAVVQLSIYDHAVIEIDARGISQPFSVQISDISENITGYYQEEIDINANIQVLGRFFVK